ncbi:hypothetical protein [Bacillus sp. C1]
MANSYKDQSYSSYSKNNCFIKTYTIFGSGNTPVNLEIIRATSQTIFENFTDNHNKTLIKLSYVNTSFAPIELIIQTRQSRTPLTIILTPGNIKTFLVEDVEKITFTNSDEVDATISLLIQQTNCICCNDKKKKCDS